MNKNFQSSYVPLNGIPTNVLTWGRWIEESLDDVTDVVICVTGNPGLPGFYSEFGSMLHENLEKNMPVWIIGHAGHDEPSNKSYLQVPKLQDNHELYNLRGQVQHKIEFIEKYVPKNSKIYFIGHSIGAWIVLELLKHDSIKKRTKKSYLLFPTIERMADSFNGKIFEFCHFLYPIYLYFLKIIYFLPGFVRLFIISVYFWLFSIPKCFKKPAMKYSKPTSIERVIFLAKDEMGTVRDLDENHLKTVKHFLKLYYGTTDGWVPVKYYNEIKEKIPELDVQLCDKGISHSFVLQHSELMAETVADWILLESNN